MTRRDALLRYRRHLRVHLSKLREASDTVELEAAKLRDMIEQAENELAMTQGGIELLTRKKESK